MSAKYFSVDDGRYRQAVEAVCERFPELRRVAPLA